MSAASSDISLDELAEGVEDESILLVDVREPHEYAAGHIPGAVSMPLSSFDPAALPHTDKRIVFACQSGKRSAAALQQARAAGRDDVAGHFPGGFAGWRAAGGPVDFD